MCKNKQKKEPEVHAVEREYDSSESNEIRTYFGSIEVGSVLKKKQSRKGLINVKIAGKEVKLKADTGAEATVIPYNLYKMITNKPLKSLHQPLKGWLATKPIYPKGCVCLPTQYKGRKIDLLYLVVDGDFTPLLGCEVLHVRSIHGSLITRLDINPTNNYRLVQRTKQKYHNPQK